MNFENPTPLHVGATGTLNGWRVRVAGRIVMGVEVDGVTYFWNEFYLLDDSGNAATLVFEETESGYEWKLFREFTPTRPLTAREAATKRVGDRVDLDGTPVAVTVVDRSRVFHIEGEAAEGVEAGDIANYFNADTGSRMLVASWTGDEIEFFEGLDMPASGVADAFGFSRDAIPTGPRAAETTANFSNDAASSFGGGSSGGSGKFTKIVLVLLGLATAFGAYSCFSGRFSRPATVAPAAKQPAPTQRLSTGTQGMLAQHTFVVTGQSVVEISRPGGRNDRREYFLRDEAGAPAILINGLSGGAKEWHLFRPVPTPAALTPADAATKRRNSPVNVGGRTAPITDLFQAKILSIDGPDAAKTPPGTVHYGFVAHDAATWIIARWTENQIEVFLGQSMPETEVITALGRTQEKK
jgi:hypothetical protein